MKKLLLLLFVVTCGLIACEGPEGPMGPQGPQGESDNVWIDVITLDLNNWTRVTPDPAYPMDFYYKYTFVPAVYNGWTYENKIYVLDNGIIKADIVFDYDTGDDVQYSMPYVYNWTDTDSQSQLIVFYLETTFDDMTIYAVPSGAQNGDYAPEDNLTFRIYIRW